MLDDLLSPSELKLVMEDLQNLPTNLVENGLTLFNEQPDMSGSSRSSHASDSDYSEPKPKRKKPKKMCDSTFVNPSFEDIQPPTNLDSLPCLVPFPGRFDFRVQLPADSSAHKWTYSNTLQKVFIDFEKVLALHFKWTIGDIKPQPEFYVRAMPVYTSHDSMKVPVTRCPIHLLRDHSSNHGFEHVEHVMRCEHSSTVYNCDPCTKRFSCRTPLSLPQAGADTTTLTYKFVCKTSCIGGMNRKPISVIFYLEDASGQEFGRQILAVKICSCPKRDKVKEETNEREKSNSSGGLAKQMDAPTLLSVRNTESSHTHPQSEALRDLKNVSSDQNVYSPASRMRSSFTSSSKSAKVKKEKELDINHVQQELVGEMREFRSDLKKFGEHLAANKELRNISQYWRYIASEADALPAPLAMEFQHDVYRILHDKKMQAMRQNMMAYGPTPGPEPPLMSPAPAANEWHYLQ
ncbi:hypothetical protein V9T40_003190 [Parthenolecanium corni]|uniref:p53 DNA-binding domain-containing protein n=1 Tax=Parthenolecanium corni TaxID=536013 RepID=A0AAN9TS35_9HEMI